MRQRDGAAEHPGRQFTWEALIRRVVQHVVQGSARAPVWIAHLPERRGQVHHRERDLPESQRPYRLSPGNGGLTPAPSEPRVERPDGARIGEYERERQVVE